MAINTDFELVLFRTGITLVVPPETSALEAILQVVPDHPFSCLGGQCGTCEVAVLSGEVDHRDEFLEGDKRIMSSAMMLCVSRALSSRIVIDL